MHCAPVLYRPGPVSYAIFDKFVTRANRKITDMQNSVSVKAKGFGGVCPDAPKRSGFGQSATHQ
jgi:hypothetical protein